MSRLFLGLDASTQSLSGIVIDFDTGRMVHDASVNFDQALPQYGTKNGVLRVEDPRVVHAPPLMWVEALDMLLDRMKKADVPMGDIRAIAGSGQQHGSVYLNRTAEHVLGALTPDRLLAPQLKEIFSRRTSPIWMDSSTSVECEEIERALGGRVATVQATGSAMYERFTAAQIRRFAKTEPAAYENTSHITLVSSFLASVLTGRITPIDHGDGAGMNLMDIRSKEWHPDALRATAPGLRAKLPALSNPWNMAGVIHPYFGKYGISPDTQCGVWTGDNPSSLIGLGLTRPGILAISLGTSYTCFGAMNECRIDPEGEGHVFVSPTGDYMSLICFKNGALARERVRDQFGLDWPTFRRLVESVPPGNNGGMMLPYFDPEIVPKVLVPGVRRHRLTDADAAANCRAICESQAYSMRLHSAWMGVKPDRIYITGGASADSSFVKIIADVFQCPVYRQECTNSAALGAALRAANMGLAADGAAHEWSDIVGRFAAPAESSRVDPDPALAKMYDVHMHVYNELETSVLSSPDEDVESTEGEHS